MPCPQPGAKVEARGLIGSARVFLAAQAVQRNGGDHLFLLEDKERAAYFMNDLENLLGEGGHQVLFYPRSARIPYQEEGTDNANVAMRAEVMSKLGALRGKVCIVSFPEAVAEQVTTRKGAEAQHLHDQTGRPDQPRLPWMTS